VGAELFHAEQKCVPLHSVQIEQLRHCYNTYYIFLKMP
jgi:hypothetical protein